ncbi:MFS transporter [Lactobacillus sp. ESL0791]|uniref:MFS transporter n=1 Tax=Lactobacillus sp. ESL0791 TaxID=2983234 RepID=UPI0023F71EF2|nr:MFS transporter [Lactobacillus sp. ESL0791]MDF7639874.1 MFS transporter [Lactobacillus sp. ESL0791]
MSVFFKNKNYRWFSVAGFLSSAGNILFYLALLTYASRLQNYSLAMSLIAITEAIPDLLQSIGGYLADRTKNKFKVITWLGVIRFVLYMIVGLLFTRSIAGWNLVLMVIALNFISDVAGVYSSGLETPLIVKLVKENDVAEAEGFTNGVSAAFQMCAQFIGSGLLLFMSYSEIAVINALTFLVAGLIFAKIGHDYRKEHQDEVEETINDQNFFATLASSFKQLRKNTGTFTVILVIALLNGVLGTLQPLISIVIAANRSIMVIGTFSFTIALVGAIGSIGAAAGSILGTTIFKKMSLLTIALLDTAFAAAMIGAIFSKSIILCLILIFFLAFFAGTASPKLEQWIVTTVDRTILASTIGAINTILIVASPLVTSISTTISAATNVNWALGMLLIVSVCVFFITLYVMKKSKKTATKVESETN